MRRSPAILCAVFASTSLIFLLTVGLLPANAAGPAALTVSITDQTNWVPAVGEFAVKLRVPPDQAGRVSVTVYEPLRTESEVKMTAAGTGLGRVEYRLPDIFWLPRTPASDPTSAGTLVIRIPVNTEAEEPGRIRLDAGVYSVVLDINIGTGARQRLITHLVHLPAAAEARRRLPVALVTDFDLPPAVTREGLSSAATDDQVRELHEMLATLDLFVEVPVSFRVSPLSLSAAANSPRYDNVIAAFTASNRRMTPLLATFAPFFLSRWIGSNLDSAAVAQLDAGRTALAELSSNRASPNTWLLGPGDDQASVEWLVKHGVTKFLAPSAGPDTRFGAALAATQPVAVAIGISGDGDPAEPRHLLTRLAVLALGNPDRGQPQPNDPAVVVQLRTADRVLYPGLLPLLLAALAQGGPLESKPLSEVIDLLTSPTGSSQPKLDLPVTRQPTGAPRTQDSFVAFAERYWQVGQQLNAMSRTVEANDTKVPALRTQLIASADERFSASEQLQLLSAISTGISTALSGIDLPVDTLLRVTSHNARLPLTVRNQSSRDLDVLISVVSTELEVEQPNPRPIHLPAGSRIDFEVPVRMSRSGDFGLTLRVTSPDGVLSLAGPTELTVRSNAISGLGLALSIAALGFLVAWWIRQARRQRPALPIQTVEGQLTPLTNAGPQREANPTSNVVSDPIP